MSEQPEAGVASDNMQWFVLRVASNKEDQVRETLERKIVIEGLESIVGRVLVPTQREKRVKGGQARVYERKIYPGYVFVEMEMNENGTIPDPVFFLIKETMSVGDFIGSDGKPIAMKPHDVERLLNEAARDEGAAQMAVDVRKGDPVKIKEGPFENFEGLVDDINQQKGTVRVIVTIFGRAAPLELEYWQIEKA